MCVEVAGGFYAELLRSEQWWGEGGVASALREAVMRQRAVDRRMPLLWAQFVHYGV
ncbi:hypothetical protein IMZ48_37615 [Candidatus Bathyarchaeota archaeon]|nr:hypothetical protein [Candidatus Bathyarchaeota archaeon]